MNKEQRLQFCSFEQAKALKRLGFDWECNDAYWWANYYNKLRFHYQLALKNWNKINDWFSAPSIALALKWMREVKILHGYTKETDRFHKFIYYVSGQGEWIIEPIFDTYEQAESALLDELIKLCEEGGK
jgi:hypothetical protein